MLEIAGDICFSRRQSLPGSMTVEIKPDLLVGEMLQECRRRNGLLLVYGLDGYIMLHSGRPI